MSTRPNKQPLFLTVAEVAELLRVKPRTIHGWVQNNKIPYRKAGRNTIFDRDEVLEWTKAKNAPAGATPIPFPR